MLDINKESSGAISFLTISRNEASVLKGVAICCVLCCHLVGALFDGRIVWFTPLGGIGVSLFLILSAYGLNESWKKSGKLYWWRKRFLAVIVPYVLVQLIFYYPCHDFKLLPSFQDVLLLQPLYGFGWYLSYLFLWYFIFYVIQTLISNKKVRIFSFVLVSVFSFFLYIHGPIRAEQSLSFLFGIIISEKLFSKTKFTNNFCFIIFLIIGAFSLGIKQLTIVREGPIVIFNLVQLIIKLSTSLGIILFVFKFFIKLSMLNKFFAFMGGISFEIYLIHGYLLSCMPQNLIGTLVFLSLTISISFLFHLFLKKTRNFQERILWIKQEKKS